MKAGIWAFVKWLIKEGWKEHSSKEYWYKDNGTWPPAATATEDELYEQFFGKQ